MKFLLFALFVLVAASAVHSIPLSEFDDLLVEDRDGERVDENSGVRQRRVTCDLLSVGGFLGDSACAANCLSMGKAGGRCSGGVCQCRVTSLKSLWDKRFG